MIRVTCQYHDRDVVSAFPGFSAPERRDALTQSAWDVEVGNNGCDGIVALFIGRAGSPSLTLTAGPDEARRIAAALVTAADREDAKLDEDDDETAPEVGAGP